MIASCPNEGGSERERERVKSQRKEEENDTIQSRFGRAEATPQTFPKTILL